MGDKPMSTPKYKKEQRMREQQAQKRKRELEAFYASLPKKSKKREFVPYVPVPVFVRETPNIPSLGDTVGGVCPLPERKVYTGTLIKGIATMHKSNAVPIINQEQAIEISQMRR